MATQTYKFADLKRALKRGDPASVINEIVANLSSEDINKAVEIFDPGLEQNLFAALTPESLQKVAASLDPSVAANLDNLPPAFLAFANPTYTDTSADDAFEDAAGTFQASDLNNNVLTYGLVNGIAIAPLEMASVTYDQVAVSDYGCLLLNTTTGAWRFMPDEDAIEALTAAAAADFTVTVSDGAFTVAQSFTVSLAGTNDAPVIGAAVLDGGDDNAGVFSVDLLQNASDVDAGSVLHIENLVVVGGAGQLPAGFSLVGNAISVDASVYDAMVAGDAVTTHYTYDVVDEHGLRVAQTAAIVINGANDAPVANDDIVGDAIAPFAETLTFDDINYWEINLSNYHGFSFSGNFGFAGATTSYYGADYTNAIYTYGTEYYGHGVMSRSDGSEFSIQGVNLTGEYRSEVGLGPATVIGYLNDVEVARQTFQIPGAEDYGLGYISTHNNMVALVGAGWQHVTEVRFSDDGTLPYGEDFTWIDNIQIRYPVVIPHTEDQALDVDVLANDTDIDRGAVLSVGTFAANSTLDAAISLNANGTLHYDPTGSSALQALDAGDTITDTFTYTVKDEHGAVSAPATVSVVLHGRNDGPVAVADSAAITENAALTIDVLANDTDVDAGHAFTLLGVSAAAGAASIVDNKLVFNAGAAFDYLAAGAQTTVNVNYTMRDEHGAQSASVATITVTGENDGPVARDDLLLPALAPKAGFLLNPANGHYYGLTGGGLNWNQASAAAAAMGGYLATVTSAAENAFIHSNLNPYPSGAWLLLGGNDAIVDGQWRWVQGPEAGTQFWQGHQNGSPVNGSYANWEAGGGASNDTYVVTRGGGYWGVVPGGFRAQGGVVEIGGRAGDPDQTPITDETAPYAINVAALLANDTDVDGTFTIVDVADTSANGAAVSLAGGVIAYNPTASATINALAAGASLLDTFTYTIVDGYGATATATVSLRVGGLNDAPVAIADVNSADADALIVTGNVLGNDSDVDLGNVIRVAGVAAGTTAGTPTAGVNLVLAGTYGTLRLEADGDYIYTLDENDPDFLDLEDGLPTPDWFTYTVADAAGAMATTTLRIDVTHDLMI